MNRNEQTISVRAERLIIQILHNRLSKAEEKELDNWLGEAEQNEELYGELTDSMGDNVFSADQLLIETKEAIDIWIIAGLVIRQEMKLNDSIEECRLDEWVNACQRNKIVYEQIKERAKLQQMLNWARPFIPPEFLKDAQN